MSQRKRFLIVAGALVLALGTPCITPAQPSNPIAPSAEMQRLAASIVGEYTVIETHHPRPGGTEWTATGTASYEMGPDRLSVLERYNSQGPRGAFSAIAAIWWDTAAGRFRHFECESGEECGVVDDSGVWDGQAIVFTRQIEHQGRRIALEERYDFTRPSEIVISTEFSVEGGPKTRTMTITYRRVRSNS